MDVAVAFRWYNVQGELRCPGCLAHLLLQRTREGPVSKDTCTLVGDTLKWVKGKLPGGHQTAVCLVRVSTPIAGQGTPTYTSNERGLLQGATQIKRSSV